MAKAIGLALLVMGCGTLDPLSGGGGDPNLLHPAGSACTSFTSSATDFDAGPACFSQATNANDSTCKTWIEQSLPPNWPTVHDECSGGKCVIVYVEQGPACKTGSAGDEYCAAWAAQFVRGNGTAKAICVGFEANTVNGNCVSDDRCACSEEQLCVERSGVSTCEDACQ